VPTSKLPKIEPRQTAVAWLATSASTTDTCANQSPYLFLTPSVRNSTVGQSQLKSPTNLHMIQTSGSAPSLKSQPSYVIVASSVGNSASHSVGNSRHSRLKSPVSMGLVQTCGTARLSSSSVVVVSRSSTSLSSVSGIAAASPFLTVSGSGGGAASSVVLQTAGLQSAPGLLTTLVLPSTPLVQIVADGSAPPVQYVLLSPTVQPISQHSPPSSVLVGNTQLSYVQTSPKYAPAQVNLTQQLSSLGNPKLTVVGKSSTDCLAVGKSQLPVIRPSIGNSVSTAVRQSSTSCLLVGNSHLSGITGIPASSAIQPPLGNTRSNVIRQSSYYIPVGNSQSSGIVGIPVSLVNSTLPQVVLLGQTAGLTGALHPQPQLLHSSSFVSASQ